MTILSSREEWLEARRGYIGGSEISAVIGRNPYKSNLELWQEKTGLITPEDIGDKPYVRYGHDAEPLLRDMFELDFPEYIVDYWDNNIWINPRFPFAHASLDGWLTEKATGRKGILEIKTTNILQSQQKEKWNGRIPDNYYCQVLWYLMVTEWDFAVLKAQLKYDFGGDIMIQTRHYKIERSEVEEDIAVLAAEGERFWESVKNKRKPALRLPEI